MQRESGIQVSGLIPTPRELFARTIEGPDESVELARAALLVAKEEHVQLPVERYLLRLDQLAEEVKDRLDDETAPLVVLQEVSRILYERHGFRGNREAYYDPRNSFLNEVLDRRSGIPLTLGIVLLEVGWRLDLPLEGVNFPGHFLVRFRGTGVRLLIDPFDRGRIRFEDEAQELLDRVYGGAARLRPGFLRSAGRREMLVRLLTNLKGIYMKLQDDSRALDAVERLLLLRPDAMGETRDRGALLARMGRHEEAIEELETYLERAPDAGDAPRVRDLVVRLERGEDVGPEGEDE